MIARNNPRTELLAAPRDSFQISLPEHILFGDFIGVGQKFVTGESVLKR